MYKPYKKNDAKRPKVSPEMMKQAQEYAKQYKANNPDATPYKVSLAVQRKFNIKLI